MDATSAVVHTEADMPKETLPARIRRLIEKKGLSQAELARRTGMDRTELNRSLNENREFKGEELAWIASVLDIAIDDLLKGIEAPSDVVTQAQKARDLAAHVVRLEAERDAAVAAHEASAKRLAELSVTSERLKVMETEARAAAAEAAKARAAAEQQVRQLRSTLEREQQAKDQVSRHLTVERLKNAKLQQEKVLLLKKISEGQLGVGALSALGGLVLGGILGAAAASDNDDEYDD